jgi:hypothetical protein
MGGFLDTFRILLHSEGNEFWTGGYWKTADLAWEKDLTDLMGIEI